MMGTSDQQEKSGLKGSPSGVSSKSMQAMRNNADACSPSPAVSRRLQRLDLPMQRRQY